MQADPHADPTRANPEKYKVVMENDRVRVLEYRDEPGHRTEMHHHLDYLFVALSAFRRQLTFPDGKKTIRQFEPGDVLWLHSQSHVGENVGETDTHAMLVELKQPAEPLQ